MNFLKGTFFICHSFRRRCKSGRMEGFQKCFQAAVRRMCRGRKDSAALLRITAPLPRKIEIEHHKPHLGNKKPLKGMIEPHVGIIKPHLGISKPAGALKKLHVNKVCTNCSKKVVLDGSKSTLKCNFCNATMSTKKCPSHFYARVILKKNETKSTLSFFHSSLISLIRLFNEQNKESLSESDITEQQLEDVILSFDTINITYDFSTFKVIEVSH